MMDDEIRDFMLHGKKESTPAPPKETFTNADIDKKRTELEILRIDNEIKRLQKPDIPDTNYFKEMLAQQQLHFNQLLEMNKQHNDLKLEIEKMKLIQDGETEPDNTLAYLEMLKPVLPAIAEAIKHKNNAPTGLKTASPKEMKGGMPKMDEKKVVEIEEYKRKIRTGELTEEQAYKDFKAMIPKAQQLAIGGKKGFKEQFDKIKNEKCPNVTNAVDAAT